MTNDYTFANTAPLKQKVNPPKFRRTLVDLLYYLTQHNLPHPLGGGWRGPYTFVILQK